MAEKTTTQLKTDNSTTFATAQPGGIPAVNERAFNVDHLDSYVNKQDTAEQGINSDLNLNNQSLVNIGNNAIQEEVIFTSGSTSDQTPTGLNVETIITFGNATSGLDVNEDGSGNIVVSTPGYYIFRNINNTRRWGGSGSARLLFYWKLNGSIAQDAGQFVGMDSPDQMYPLHHIYRPGFLNAGAIINAAFLRDGSSGQNDGIITFTNPGSGFPWIWSAYLIVSRLKAFV